MKYFVVILGMILTSSLSACQDPIQKPPDNNDLDILWKATISPSLLEGKFPKVVYKNTVVSHGWKNGKFALLAFDKNTGKELWTWNDTFTRNDGSAHNAQTEFIHVFDNVLIWRNVNRVYGINLDNGTTAWKERFEGSGFLADYLSGLGNRFLFNTRHPLYFAGTVKQGNIQRLSLPLQFAERTQHDASFLFLNTPPNVLENAALNDTIAVLPFGIPITGQVAIGFTVFNLTQNKEIYTKTIPGDNIGAFGPPPLLHNGTLYFDAGPWIHAFDLKTGNKLWSERFPSQFSFSGIIYYDGMIIGNCEDTFMYALDAKTGKQLWATKTSGTSSRLFEMNGVIYFTGGGDGLLHAVDAKTGRHIWKKESPDESRFNGAWFFDSVTGADGKIYVSSYISLFCYKAAR
ncbi:MAG: PQQ-binding-like beta-propeller repeat protein [Candidatus Kapabacteria bacterium]|jgi:outer membrane protein assembly factor BamB|nr:PQQ-binding-like beta-propeller repeat protein [Candidatus Kapabacteria bacterium]